MPSHMDMWHKVGRALREGERQVVAVMTESHVTGAEILAGFSSFRLMQGNETADQLASKAVEHLELSEDQLQAWRWQLGAAHKVQDRIAQATAAAFEATEPLPAAAVPRPRDRPRAPRRLRMRLAAAGHSLEYTDRTGERCLNCCQATHPNFLERG